MPRISWFVSAPARSESALLAVHRRMLVFVSAVTFYGTALLTIWAVKPLGPHLSGCSSWRMGSVKE